MDPQLQQRLMLFAGFIPGGISFAILLTAWYLHALRASKTDLDDEERTPTVGPRWILPLLLAMGVIGADFAINDTFQLWPHSNNDRLPHAAVLLALAGIIEGLVVLPVLIAALVRAVAYAGVFWMLASGYTETVLGGNDQLIGYTLFAALATSIIATAADRVAEHNKHERGLGWLDSITLVMILGAIMPAFVMNSYAQGGMYPPGLISVLSSAFLVGLIFRSMSIARGGITFVYGFFLMMLIGSIVQTGVMNWPPVLLAGALPLIMLVPLRTPSSLNRLLARFAMIAVIGGMVALTAFGDRISFWPGKDDASESGAPSEEGSLEDYYNNLE